MTGTMALDYALCYAFEQMLKYLFADSMPKAIAVRRRDQLDREIQSGEIVEKMISTE